MGINRTRTESRKKTKVLDLLQFTGYSLKDLHDAWVVFHSRIDNAKAEGLIEVGELVIAGLKAQKENHVSIIAIFIVLGMSKLDDICKELLEENHGKANFGQK